MSLFLFGLLAACDNPELSGVVNMDRYLPPATTATVTGAARISNDGASRDFPEITADTALKVFLYNDLSFPPAGPPQVYYEVCPYCVDADGLRGPCADPKEISKSLGCDEYLEAAPGGECHPCTEILDPALMNSSAGQSIDIEIDASQGLYQGEFSAMLRLDYGDETGECTGMIGVPDFMNGKLPVALTVAEEGDLSLDIELSMGDCELKSAAGTTTETTAEIKGVITFSEGAPSEIGSSAVLYVSLYSDPDDPANPSGRPTVSKVVDIAAHRGETVPAEGLEISYTMGADDGLTAGDWAVSAVLYQSGIPGPPGSGDCVGSMADPKVLTVAQSGAVEADLLFTFCFP